MKRYDEAIGLLTLVWCIFLPSLSRTLVQGGPLSKIFFTCNTGKSAPTNTSLTSVHLLHFSWHICLKAMTLSFACQDGNMTHFQANTCTKPGLQCRFDTCHLFSRLNDSPRVPGKVLGRNPCQKTICFTSISWPTCKQKRQPALDSTDKKHMKPPTST